MWGDLQSRKLIDRFSLALGLFGAEEDDARLTFFPSISFDQDE
jgi:hypothetical protein